MKDYLRTIDQIIEKGPYKAEWESLAAHSVPEWFRDAKFGIFIHWGVYSVPAFANEWYPRTMYIRGTDEFRHHVETYGPHKEFGYKDFVPMFKAEHFDTEEWADLFARAGAKYVVPVGEHHDGFQMYKSSISRWNAAEMGPERDTYGELCGQFDKKDLVRGISSHRAEHWFFMGHGKEFDSDIREPLSRGDFYWPAMPEQELQDIDSQPAPTEEYLEDWLVRTAEIIDSYHPQLLYFDWWIQHRSFKPWLKKLAAYYYNRAAEWGEEVLITYKHDAFMFGTAVLDVERGQFADVKPFCWQTCAAVALNSWCYTPGNRYRKAADIICDLVDIVSKNGCLLLNVGPKADGTIPEEDRNILLEIGRWLEKNGDAIYGTRVWRIFGEGPTKVTESEFSDDIRKEFTSRDIRYTCKGDGIYAIVMRPSEDGSYVLPALGERHASGMGGFHGVITGVTLLGSDVSCSWHRDNEGLKIEVPQKAATSGEDRDKPIAFRITVM